MSEGEIKPTHELLLPCIHTMPIYTLLPMEVSREAQVCHAQGLSGVVSRAPALRALPVPSRGASPALAGPVQRLVQGAQGDAGFRHLPGEHQQKK